MKGFHRVLVSIYVGIAVYLAASIFFGGSGVLAMRKLESYSQRLDTNVGELIERNSELKGELESLLGDEERLKLEARVLGYYGDDEKVIEYKARNSSSPRSLSLGRIMKESLTRQDIRSPLRVVALVVAFCCYVVLSYMSIRNDHR